MQEIMNKVWLSIVSVLIPISAFADGGQYFQHVRSLYNQGKYDEALLGFQNCKKYYPADKDLQNADYWINECTSKIEAKAKAAKEARERRARANAAAQKALQQRRDKRLIYISSDALNLDGREYDLSKVIIKKVQDETGLLFTTDPDDAFYYTYVSAFARNHHYENGRYASNVVANVMVKDMDDVVHFADRAEETQMSTLNYAEAAELCYDRVGNAIGEGISRRIGGVVKAPQDRDKKAIAVAVSSNKIKVSDLGFVETHFRNAFQEAGFDVKIPNSGVMNELRSKAIAYHETGHVSISEAKHLSEEIGADLLCAVVVDYNESFNVYVFSASTFDLAKGTIFGKEASITMPNDGQSIGDIHAVLAAVGTLIEGMQLPIDESFIKTHQAQHATIVQDGHQRDSLKTIQIEKEFCIAKARAFVPGLAQLKDGATGLGITFIAGEAVCIGGIAVSQYLSSLYASQIGSTHSATEKQRLAQMSNICNVATYVSAAGAIGLYVWNIVDGLSRAKKLKKVCGLVPYYDLESYGFTLALNF